jgi:gliding motility-associated protein GldC
MKSNITITVTLNDEKMPEQIEWVAPGGGVDNPQTVKGILLGLWDGQEKSALRIDLWTTKMMVDEMNDFFYQTLHGMADTYLRATKNSERAQEMHDFAISFLKKASSDMEKQP